MIGDAALYVWGSYVMGLALVMTEMLLLRIRYKAIRGQSGWFRGNRQPVAETQVERTLRIEVDGKV